MDTHGETSELHRKLHHPSFPMHTVWKYEFNLFEKSKQNIDVNLNSVRYFEIPDVVKGEYLRTKIVRNIRRYVK